VRKRGRIKGGLTGSTLPLEVKQISMGNLSAPQDGPEIFKRRGGVWFKKWRGMGHGVRDIGEQNKTWAIEVFLRDGGWKRAVDYVFKVIYKLREKRRKKTNLLRFPSKGILRRLVIITPSHGRSKTERGEGLTGVAGEGLEGRIKERWGEKSRGRGTCASRVRA